MKRKTRWRLIPLILSLLASLAAAILFALRGRRGQTLADTAVKLARDELARAKATKVQAEKDAQESVTTADEAARKEIDRDESLADTLGRFGAGR